MMIRFYQPKDFNEVLSVINDGARSYKGVIPDDCWHEPYMTAEYLEKEISLGVRFCCYVQDNEIAGVMAIQDFPDVSLIRHAYVKVSSQKKGIGSAILKHIFSSVSRPVLVGTWASTPWSIKFYEKYGFRLLRNEEGQELLKKYWPNITQRHRDVSVVLVGRTYSTPEVER